MFYAPVTPASLFQQKGEAPCFHFALLLFLQMKDFLATTPAELRLTVALDLVQTCDYAPLALKALRFLRHHAIAYDNIEAKVKLYTLYTTNENEKSGSSSSGVVQANAREADLWTYSLYDKSITDALYACNDILTTDDRPVTEMIGDNNNPQQKKKPDIAYLAGILTTRGVGCKQDVQRGMILLQRAAQLGHAKAAYELGKLWDDGYSYSLRDRSKAIPWYKRAIELGDKRAHVDLANDCYAAREPARAREHAMQGAQWLNNRFCQYLLGVLAFSSSLSMSNTTTMAEALKWLTAAAQQDFALAIEETARLYFKIQKDYAQAYRWCSTTKAGDIPFCQTVLGDLYRNGWAVSRDYSKAFTHYQHAASHRESPNHYAQHMIGEM